MTEKERPAVGTPVRILDQKYIGVDTIMHVVEDDKYTGMFGQDEITLAEEDGGNWYAEVALEGTAWERVEVAD